MTVLAMQEQQSNEAVGSRPLPWRRMAWVTWRQHRASVISVPAVLAAIALVLLIAGLIIHHNYAVLTACYSAGSMPCGHLNSVFNQTDWAIGNGFNIVLNLGPPLIGAFVGAPLLSRELETGTFRFAWTQGFGRERSTIAKLTMLGGLVAVAAGVFSLVWDWFFQPFLRQEGLGVMSNAVFDHRPIAYAAWTLVAFAIGAGAGMLIRRVVPAMATTLGLFAALRIAAWLLLDSNARQASQFWPLQLAEGGCLLVLAVVLFATTVWLVRRRAV
jgi:hypothetical protein